MLPASSLRTLAATLLRSHPVCGQAQTTALRAAAAASVQVSKPDLSALFTPPAPRRCHSLFSKRSLPSASVVAGQRMVRSYARLPGPGRRVKRIRSPSQPASSDVERDTKPSILNAEYSIDPSVLATGDEVITSESPSAHILEHAAIVISRNVEMLNLLVGFEQANRYLMRDPLGNPVGFVVEEDSLFTSIMRQVFRLHRRFTSLVLDASSQPVLRIHRPFTLINSTIYVQDHNGKLIGFVRQRWHLWRRKYDLYLADHSQAPTSEVTALEKASEKKPLTFDVSNMLPIWSQIPHFKFGTIDMPFLSWIFDIRGQRGELLARIDKDFTGFAREIFTDARQYVLKMDLLESDIPRERPLYYDERAVALACAITIDHDYFSLHSGGPGWFPLLWIFASE